MIESLSSGNFSNFSHSFIGDIYHQTSKWGTLYKYLQRCKIGENYEEIVIKTMWNRIKEINPNFSAEDFLELSKTFKEDSVCTRTHMTNDRDFFEDDILNDIGLNNRHFLDPTYSVAMALKYYHEAIGINSEGEEYKEMIKGMYIVNDDVSNGMQNFWLALERYTMNCGVIDKKMNRLRKYYRESLSHGPKTT